MKPFFAVLERGATSMSYCKSLGTTLEFVGRIRDKAVRLNAYMCLKRQRMGWGPSKTGQ